MNTNSNRGILIAIIVIVLFLIGYSFFNSPSVKNYLTANPYGAVAYPVSYPVSYSYTTQPKSYITYPIASASAISYNTPATYYSTSYYPQNTTATYYPPVYGGGCYASGCSGQICSDQPNTVSTCEYRAEYACYQYSQCQRQSNGQCGWTPTSSFLSCLNNIY